VSNTGQQHTPAAFLDSLQAALDQAKAEQEQASQRLHTAKADLATAKANVRRFETAFTLLSEKPRNGSNGSVTKDVVRPYLRQLLATGALADAELSERLQTLLRKDSVATSGIALVLRALKKEFVGPDGSWSLPSSEAPPNGSHTAAKPAASPLKP
jgi:multidrug resistance efflux pump